MGVFLLRSMLLSNDYFCQDESSMRQISVLFSINTTFVRNSSVLPNLTTAKFIFTP